MKTPTPGGWFLDIMGMGWSDIISMEVLSWKRHSLTRKCRESSVVAVWHKEFFDEHRASGAKQHLALHCGGVPQLVVPTNCRPTTTYAAQGHEA
jgi:hypothetical protein